MKAFLAFTKKELVESWRTYRLAVMLATFAIFGIISPLLAKLMPEILKGGMGDTGIVITVPDPTALDAWTQFFGNIGQMGMLVLIIAFCGIMASELSRGTLVNLLTKGLPRHTVVLSKFLVATIVWTASYLVSLAICYAYTAYFWPGSQLHHAALAFGGLWLFGQLVIALLLFGGTLFKNIYGALLTCGGLILAANLLAIVPETQKYNPLSLVGNTLSLLSAQSTPTDFAPAFALAVALIVAFVLATIAIFNKKQI